MPRKKKSENSQSEKGQSEVRIPLTDEQIKNLEMIARIYQHENIEEYLKKLILTHLADHIYLVEG